MSCRSNLKWRGYDSLCGRYAIRKPNGHAASGFWYVKARDVDGVWTEIGWDLDTFADARRRAEEHAAERQKKK